MITPLPYWNFNPVLPTAFDDSLSYLEMVSKLYKKLEEVIAEVNEIDQEAIQQALDDMRAEIAKFEAQIQKQYNALDEKYQKLYEELNNSILELADTTAASLEELDTKIYNLGESLKDIMDLKIEENNEYIFESIASEIIGIKVLNYFTGEKVTVQEMFDYLAQLHAMDGITVTELITRQKTVNELVALKFTYTQLAQNGKNIIV
jgi:seryl-tRNA synthetase